MDWGAGGLALPGMIEAVLCCAGDWRSREHGLQVHRQFMRAYNRSFSGGTVDRVPPLVSYDCAGGGSGFEPVA